MFVKYPFCYDAPKKYHSDFGYFVSSNHKISSSYVFIILRNKIETFLHMDFDTKTDDWIKGVPVMVLNNNFFPIIKKMFFSYTPW